MSPKERRLVSGKGTIGLKPKGEIKLGPAKKMVIKEVGEDGQLTVEVQVLIDGKFQHRHTNPLVLDTPVTVLDKD